MYLILLVFFVWSYYVFLRSEYEGACRIYVICVCLHIVVSTTYCVVYLCFVCLRPVYPMLPVSLECPFLIAPSVFSNVYFRPVSCVPSVASISGFSPSVFSNVYFRSMSCVTVVANV
jgi:hypothetical protein